MLYTKCIVSFIRVPQGCFLRSVGQFFVQRLNPLSEARLAGRGALNRRVNWPWSLEYETDLAYSGAHGHTAQTGTAWLCAPWHSSRNTPHRSIAPKGFLLTNAISCDSPSDRSYYCCTVYPPGLHLQYGRPSWPDSLQVAPVTPLTSTYGYVTQWRAKLACQL